MAIVIYRDQADRPSPVHADVRCFASCVGRTCYRSCHPGTLRDGLRAVGQCAVYVIDGLIVEAWERPDGGHWRAL